MEYYLAAGPVTTRHLTWNYRIVTTLSISVQRTKENSSGNKPGEKYSDGARNGTELFSFFFFFQKFRRALDPPYFSGEERGGGKISSRTILV